MDDDTNPTDEPLEPDPDVATLADRLAHLENILEALLTAHGETYRGASEQLGTLRGHIASHH